MQDSFDLPITTPSLEAARAYDAAVANLLCAGPDLSAGFVRALELDPHFALATAALARTQAIYGEGVKAKATAIRACELAEALGPREQQHARVLALVVQGESSKALLAIREHLREYPRDALVLQPALSAFGLIGFSGAGTRVADLHEFLEMYEPHYQGSWWFDSVMAFAQAEVGLTDKAEARARRSLELMPRNANAAHALSHVFYERKEPRSATRFLADWLGTHRHRSILRGHLAWHLALTELELGNPELAVQHYEREVACELTNPGLPPVPPLNMLTDAASFLWRAELQGCAVRTSDWEQLATFASERFPSGGPIFGQVHAAFAYARTANAEQFALLLERLRGSAASRPDHKVAADICSAVWAFQQQDWFGVRRFISEVEHELMRIGGSRAQVDIVSLTGEAADKRILDGAVLQAESTRY